MLDVGELGELVRIVERAGQRATELQATVRRQLDKADGTVVTDADVQVEEQLREELEAAFGVVPVVGEEEGGVLGREAVVVIDPIDGTLSYWRGSPLWTVSVGVVFGGRPVAGVVCAPALGMTWAGAAGVGATCNGHRIAAAAFEPSRHGLVAVTTEAVRRYGAPPRKLGHLRCLGGIALQIVMCADGKVDAAVCCLWHVWDVAGALGVLLAAGGQVVRARDGSDASNLLDLGEGEDIVAGGPDIAALVPRPIPQWLE